MRYYKMKCPRCGAKNYNESYYCRNCGLAMEPDIEVGENFTVGNPRSFFGQDDNSKPANAFADENAQQDYERQSRYAEYHPPKRYDQDDIVQAVHNVTNESYFKKITQVTIAIILTIVFCLGMVVFSAWCRYNNTDILSIIVSANKVQPLEIPTPPDIEIYLAKLSGSKHNVASYTDENMVVQFPIPEKYALDEGSSENFAVFKRAFNDGTSTLFSAVIYSGDVQKEIDYFNNLQAEDGLPFHKEVVDTSLGKMTLLTLDKPSSGTVIYHAYLKLDDKNYFHISLSNIKEEHKNEARKLIDLIVQDSRYMDMNK